MSKRDFRINRTNQSKLSPRFDKLGNSLTLSQENPSPISSTFRSEQKRFLRKSRQQREGIKSFLTNNQSSLDSNMSSSLPSRNDLGVKSQFSNRTMNDSKIQELFDKIVDQDNNKVYDTEEHPNRMPYLPLINIEDQTMSKNMLTPNGPMTSKEKSTVLEFPPKQLVFLTPRANLKYLDASPSIIRSIEGGSVADSQEDPYRIHKKRSKLEEINELKRQNAHLKKENSILQSEMKEIDEFELILRKKTKIENFNEKRCDILKACVQKQKRYIDYMHRSLVLTRKFHKDMLHILQFLIDLDKKYMKSEIKMNEVYYQKVPAQNQVDLANKVISDLYAEMGNADLIKNFMRNFNEAYAKIKASNEKSEEVPKLFNLTLDIIKASNPLTMKVNPEVQKKIKYNYMFSQFIKEYKKIFPIYTVFNEFDLKDKNDFSQFLNQMIVMAQKVDEIFKKIKNFDMLKHSYFIYNENIPENLIEHAADFEYYFNSKNKNKRIFLNFKELFNMEQSLSNLLDKLINFHNSLLQKKEIITTEQVLELEENLRDNIEKLLMLGITTNCDFSRKDKIIIVNEKQTPDILKSNQNLEKKILFEIYNEEFEKMKEYDKCKERTFSLIEEITSNLKDLNQPTGKIKNLKYLVELMNYQYNDLGIITRVKDCELTYLREYSKIISHDIENMGYTIKEKLSLMDEFLNSVAKNLGELNKLVEYTFEFSTTTTDLKSRYDFVKKFKQINKDILETVNKVLGKQPDNPYGDILRLNEIFKTELLNLKKSHMFNSDKLKDLKIHIQKII